jgi:phage terminase small subunit
VSSQALTTKQEAFAQAIASGMNQSDAYRAAYDASGMKASSVTEKASELAANVKVTSRVESLKAELAEKQLWTRQDSVTELADIARGAESKAAEKIAAIKELNLMHGFNAPTKIEMGGVLIHKIERVIVDPKN